MVEPDEGGLAGFTIYLDLNQNGILDEGEPTSITDPEGRYNFVNLPVARDENGNLQPYVVRQVPQPGFTQSTPDAVVTLVEGESASFVNIGNAPGSLAGAPPTSITPQAPPVITPPPGNGGTTTDGTNNVLTSDESVIGDAGSEPEVGGNTGGLDNVLTSDESVIGDAQTEPEVDESNEDELSSDESIVGESQTEAGDGDLSASSLNAFDPLTNPGVSADGGEEFRTISSLEDSEFGASTIALEDLETDSLIDVFAATEF